MLLIIFNVLVFSFSPVLRKWLLFWTSAEFLNTFFSIFLAKILKRNTSLDHSVPLQKYKISFIYTKSLRISVTVAKPPNTALNIKA